MTSGLEFIVVVKCTIHRSTLGVEVEVWYLGKRLSQCPSGYCGEERAPMTRGLEFM